MVDTVQIPDESLSSRFVRTSLVNSSGVLSYGLWEPPEIILNGTESAITVDSTNENRPDLISVAAYGTSDYWWAIMYVNNILMPIRDLSAGTILTIPSLQAIENALSRVRR